MHTLGVSEMATPDEVIYMPQGGTTLFTISIISTPDGIPITVMACGSEITYTAEIYGEDFYAALVEIDRRLDDHQEAHPFMIVVDFCSNEIIEILNLLLEIAGLRPVSEDDFNFSDILFWLSNPALAMQMGHGL